MSDRVSTLQVPGPKHELTYTKPPCLMTTTSIHCVGSGSEVKVVAFGVQKKKKKKKTPLFNYQKLYPLCGLRIIIQGYTSWIKKKKKKKKKTLLKIYVQKRTLVSWMTIGS